MKLIFSIGYWLEDSYYYKTDEDINDQTWNTLFNSYMDDSVNIKLQNSLEILDEEGEAVDFIKMEYKKL